jgi:hypothetical protein
MKAAVGEWDADNCRVAGVKAATAPPFAGVFYEHIDSIYNAV